MFRTSDGSPWLRYGQTPVALQRRDFDRLADYLGTTTAEDAAESVLAMSPLERAELLQRFYISVGLSGAADAYEVIKGERHPFSKACLQHSLTVIRPCMSFREEPSQLFLGQMV